MTILTNTYSASSANAAYASSTQSSNGSHPTFSEEMYSDPEMRPYLEQYYEKAYAPMRERIAENSSNVRARMDIRPKPSRPKTVALRRKFRRINMKP